MPKKRLAVRRKHALLRGKVAAAKGLPLELADRLVGESKEELEEYVAKEKARIEKAYQYYNHLTSLVALEGTMPFINLANNVVDNPTPIEVYAKESK